VREVLWAMRFKAILVLSATLAAVIASQGAAEERPKALAVGGKPFTEQLVLAHMLGELVESRLGIKVERKLPLGGTLICLEALKRGSRRGGIDFYVEYTGTGLMSVLKMPKVDDPAEAFRRVSEEFKRRWDLIWLPPLGFNNTYTLAVKADLARKHDLRTFSDLARVSEGLILGADLEFLERPDGYPGLREVYGMRFKETRSMNPALRYVAMENDQIQVMDAYATDGMLLKYDLTVLKDDKGFFPAYEAAVLIREDVLRAIPELEGTLKLLSGKLDDETMRRLNYQVDVLGKEPLEVARAFLKELGLSR